MGSDKSKVFLQLDSDRHPSSFDSIVAIDAGADHILPFSNVDEKDVTGLVHGAMFTRSPRSLHNTVVSIGGSDYAQAHSNYKTAIKTLFPPLNVSVFFDPCGAHTTASAAVYLALSHVRLQQPTPNSVFQKIQLAGSKDRQAVIEKQNAEGLRALVLGATGPVGRCVAKILAGCSIPVTLVSRSMEKVEKVRSELIEDFDAAEPLPKIDCCVTGEVFAEDRSVSKFDFVFSCGAAGVTLVDSRLFEEMSAQPMVMVDLNAVPPAGIVGVEVGDAAKSVGQAVCYGAIGVGNQKMLVHKKAIETCFQQTGHQMGLEQIFAHCINWLST